MSDSLKTDDYKNATPAEGGRGHVAALIRFAIPVALLGAGWLGFSLLSIAPEKPKSEPVKPEGVRTRIVELREQDYPVLVKANGIVRPHNEISVAAQVSGRIARIAPEFEDGAFFSKGDLLVELESFDYAAAVAVANARLKRSEAGMKLAKLNHDRNLKVFDENLISEAEVDVTAATLAQLEADVASAKAQLEQAQRDLERTRVIAPFDGRVRQRNVGPGQLVGSGTSLGTVFSVDFAEVRLPISGPELAFIELPETESDRQLKVELRDAANPNSTNVWKGRIVRSEGALDDNTLALFAIARIDDPFGRTSGHPPLRIGQPVVGHITGRTLKNVVALPRAAVRQLDQVFLVEKPDMTLRAHTIVPLWQDQEHIIVRDPLIREGMLLALSHLVYAPEGAQVEIIPDIDTNIVVTATSSNTSAVKPQAAKTSTTKKAGT